MLRQFACTLCWRRACRSLLSKSVVPGGSCHPGWDGVNFSTRDLATLNSDEINSYHAIIGADICFWDAIVEPLFNMIARSSGPKPPTILIADPGRPPFWELAERCVEEFDAEVISRNSYTPRRTQTFFLRLENE